MTSPSKKIFWIASALLLPLYFLSKMFASPIIEWLFTQESFNLLNVLAGISAPQSLDFYLGIINDRIIGPAQSLTTGLFFTGLCLIYLQKNRMRTFVFAVLSFLIISKWEVLLFPPYGDSLLGPFTDAVWLVRHSLDYPALLAQGSFDTGGPQIYPASIYPLFLSTLMYYLPNPQTFLVIIHILIFAGAALTVGIIREVCRSFADDKTSLLASLIILFHPLFQSMSEQINMEVPMLTFAILTIYFIGHQKFGWASLCAILSLLIKAPGAVSCLAVFVMCLIFMMLAKSLKTRLQYLGWGLLSISSVLIKFIIRNRLIGDQVSYNKVGWWIGLENIFGMAEFWVFVTLFILASGYFIFHFKSIIEDLKNNKNVPKIIFLVASLVISAGWFIQYANFSIMTYRYKLLLLPFLLIGLIFCLHKFKIHSSLINKGSLLILPIFMLCSYGLHYTWDDTNYGCNTFERSLEYRGDLKLHKRVALEIESQYANETIAAPPLIAQALSFFEVGYVNQPLNVMIYSMRSPMEGLSDFKGLATLDLQRTVWIGFPTDALNRIIPNFQYPVGSQDKVIKFLSSGRKKVVLFRGGFQIEKVRRTIEQFNKK